MLPLLATRLSNAVDLVEDDPLEPLDKLDMLLDAREKEQLENMRNRDQDLASIPVLLELTQELPVKLHLLERGVRLAAKASVNLSTDLIHERLRRCDVNNNGGVVGS